MWWVCSISASLDDSTWLSASKSSWERLALYCIFFSSSLSSCQAQSSDFHHTNKRNDSSKCSFCSRKEPNLPLLEFRWGNESRSAILGVFQFALPPVMVIFVDNLDYVTHSEANPCLFTGDEVILHRVILELCSYIDLRRRGMISWSQKSPRVQRKGLTDRRGQGTYGGQGTTGHQGTSGDQVLVAMRGMLGWSWVWVWVILQSPCWTVSAVGYQTTVWEQSGVWLPH